MGIYVFNWSTLKEYLTMDEQDESSSNDFGKNIIPNMLAAGEKLSAYRFDSYWKDVGTIDSLWESNMDLLDPKSGLNLDDPTWRIYSKTPSAPPQFISDTARVQNSLVTEGCNIYGTVDFSVLFERVTVEEGAEVRDSLVFPGARICKGASVQYAIVAENAVIGAGARIGERPENIDAAGKESWGVAVIGADVKISDGAVVGPKAMVDSEAEGGETR